MSSLNCCGQDESKKLSGNGLKEGGSGKGSPEDVLNDGGGGKAGGDGGGERLLSSVGFCLSFNLFNRFLITISNPGGVGVYLIRSLDKFFFPKSSSLRREPTIGFSASNVEISSKTSSKRFCLLRIFLFIGSSFC